MESHAPALKSSLLEVIESCWPTTVFTLSHVVLPGFHGAGKSNLCVSESGGDPSENTVMGTANVSKNRIYVENVILTTKISSPLFFLFPLIILPRTPQLYLA